MASSGAIQPTGIRMVGNGRILQVVPSIEHAHAFQLIQAYFTTPVKWWRRLLGWETCLTCKGRGRIIILSHEALEADGDDVLRWAHWTAFWPPIEIEDTQTCPDCKGLGRIKSSHHMAEC